MPDEPSGIGGHTLNSATHVFDKPTCQCLFGKVYHSISTLKTV